MYTENFSPKNMIDWYNWPEKTKSERHQWKKPEWNEAESIRQKEQARIITNRIGLWQNATTEQGRIFYQ